MSAPRVANFSTVIKKIQKKNNKKKAEGVAVRHPRPPPFPIFDFFFDFFF
jgi:hypothetical protein